MINLKEGCRKLEDMMRTPRVDNDSRFSCSYDCMIIDRAIVNDLIGIDLEMLYGNGRYGDGSFLAFSRNILDIDGFDSLLNNEYFSQHHDSSMTSSMICYATPHSSIAASMSSIGHLAQRFYDSIDSAQIYPWEICNMIDDRYVGKISNYYKEYVNLENLINAEIERDKIDEYIKSVPVVFKDNARSL